MTRKFVKRSTFLSVLRKYPWLIHANVWQKPLQYGKMVGLQLIKINEEKKKRTATLPRKRKAKTRGMNEPIPNLLVSLQVFAVKSPGGSNQT